MATEADENNNYKYPPNYGDGHYHEEYLEDRDGLILGLMVFFAILTAAGLGFLGWCIYQLIFNYTAPKPPSS